MDYKKYCVLSGTLFSLVALAHFLRLIYGMSIRIDDYVVPMSVSWLGLIVTAVLAFWAFKISREENAA